MTLDGVPGLARALESCWIYKQMCVGDCSPTPTSWELGAITRNDRFVCEGTYTYSEDEWWAGPQAWSVTVSGVNSLGQRVNSTRSIYTKPRAPQPAAYIYGPMQGCQADMQGRSLSTAHQP